MNISAWINIVDNANDTSPLNWINIMYYGRIWRDWNFDVVIIPYNSKYNCIIINYMIIFPILKAQYG